MPAELAPMIDNPDCVFQHNDVTLLLKEGRYRQITADLSDDGIIDQIAVERRAAGDMAVRVTQREMLCAIAFLVANDYNDHQIASRLFGDPDLDDRVYKMRTRARIASPGAEVLVLPMHDREFDLAAA